MVDTSTSQNSSTVAPTLICPSVDACAAFGIRRNGTNSTDNDTYSFLKGPQFKNTRVSTYQGTPQSPMDEVIMEFIGNRPVAIKPVRDGDIVKMEIQQKEIYKNLYTIRIAPNTTDWLSFNFNHEWSEGDGIMAKVLDTISGLVDSASGIINTVQNVGSGAGANQPQPRRKITLDKQDTYQKTDKVEFNIPFTLFSSGYGQYNLKGDAAGNPIEQWINDVYQPLMVITALSHPKRQTGVIDFGKDKNGNPITGGDETPSNRATESTAQNQQGQQGTVDEAQTNVLQVLSSYPGMRVAISEPPSYIRIKHSSGFFEYNVCAIKSFKYSFKGPWVKAYSLNKEGAKVFENQKKLMNLTLPMVVECELGIKVIEKMYADDYVEMFRNSPILKMGGSSGRSATDGIVNVYRSDESVSQTQTSANT